jgi:hypothetical protein
MAARSLFVRDTVAARDLINVAIAPRRGQSDRPMINRLAGALAVAAVCAFVAACDTRSNKDLNGVATWPMGGPAHGAWNDPPPVAESHGSTETTTTTTTVRSGGR